MGGACAPSGFLPPLVSFRSCPLPAPIHPPHAPLLPGPAELILPPVGHRRAQGPWPPRPPDRLYQSRVAGAGWDPGVVWMFLLAPFLAPVSVPPSIGTLSLTQCCLLAHRDLPLVAPSCCTPRSALQVLRRACLDQLAGLDDDEILCDVELEVPVGDVDSPWSSCVRPCTLLGP